jgi:hypothetical protein
VATSEQETVAADDRDAELAALRAQVAALEAELAETHRRANAAIAAAQDRAYWLDRWHVDLNAVMARPGAGELRAVARAVRSVFRWLKRALRAVSS